VLLHVLQLLCSKFSTLIIHAYNIVNFLRHSVTWTHFLRSLYSRQMVAQKRIDLKSHHVLPIITDTWKGWDHNEWGVLPIIEMLKEVEIQWMGSAPIMVAIAV
jgi:hypothetical protein